MSIMFNGKKKKAVLISTNRKRAGSVLDGSITEITYEDLYGATELPQLIFYNYSNLTKIQIPSSIKSIGRQALGYCKQLRTIEYEGTKSEWNSITKDSRWTEGTGLKYSIYCSDGVV